MIVTVNKLNGEIKRVSSSTIIPEDNESEFSFIVEDASFFDSFITGKIEKYDVVNRKFIIKENKLVLEERVAELEDIILMLTV